jgi:hypothetical protein
MVGNGKVGNCMVGNGKAGNCTYLCIGNVDQRTNEPTHQRTNAPPHQRTTAQHVCTITNVRSAHAPHLEPSLVHIDDGRSHHFVSDREYPQVGLRATFGLRACMITGNP